MWHSRQYLCSVTAGLLILLSSSATAEDTTRVLNQFLSEGRLADSEKYFSKASQLDSSTAEEHTALGITRFLQAIEYLGQSGYRYGLMSHRARTLPMLRMPVPLNPNPEQLSYETLREIVTTFQSKLASAESAMANANTESLRLDFYIGDVALDLDQNGEASEPEKLWSIFIAISRREAAPQFGVNGDPAESADSTAEMRRAAEEFYVGIDGADVHWLRGYCHVLMAMCDFALAYDEKELFEHCGQIFFPNIKSPYLIPSIADKSENRFIDVELLMDGIAAIHLIDFKLVDAERMKSSRQHLLAMIAQSRESWSRALQETDNDHEWIPNPKQTGVLNLPVRNELITGWHAVLNEMEDVLEGEKLVPMLRDFAWVNSVDTTKADRGINLKKFFDEPSDFDLILAIHGSGVSQYLESGKVSSEETWMRLTQIFQGQFFGFAVWFN